MDLGIALYLGQNGVTLAAIYALLAFALVLVFAVTRVIFIPQGEIMSFGALSLVAIHAGQVPQAVWLLPLLGAGACVVDAPVALQHAKPSDTAAFRTALRNALEGLKNIAGADGIYSMSVTDHNGLDDRAVVMTRIENGRWVLLK